MRKDGNEIGKDESEIEKDEKRWASDGKKVEKKMARKQVACSKDANQV